MRKNNQLPRSQFYLEFSTPEYLSDGNLPEVSKRTKSNLRNKCDVIFWLNELKIIKRGGYSRGKSTAYKDK